MNKFISIIIPVLNSGKYLDMCLSSLMDLDYLKDRFEIIVVDNGSSDNTIEIAEKYKVKLLQQKKCTISALRNLGARHSRGEILAFIDADCIAPKCWLSKAVELFENDKIGATGCWYSLPENPSLIEKVWDINAAKRRDRIGYVDWIPSSNLIIPRSVFLKVNCFNERLLTSEDVDICERIRNIGMGLFSHPQLSVVHLRNPKSIKEFFLKEMWRGAGVLQNFLSSFPKLKFNRAISLAITTLILFFCLMLGIATWIITGNKIIFLFSLIITVLVFLGLSIVPVFKNKQWRYLLPFIFLNITYGFSRALNILDFRIWEYYIRMRRMVFNVLWPNRLGLDRNVLFVTPRLPYPADTGAKVRTLNLLKQAKNSGNNLILLSFLFNKEEKKWIKSIEDMGIKVITVKGRDKIRISTVMKALIHGLPLTVVKYHSKKMVSVLNQLIAQGNIDLVHFDHIHLGQYCSLCNGISSIIDEHNVESVILKRMLEMESNFLKRLILSNEYKKMSRLEKEKCHRASLVSVVSEEDKNNLGQLCINRINIEVIPNGVDTEYFKMQHVSRITQDEDSIVFTGSLDWTPNSDAVIYFCKEILPLIWKVNDKVKFYIVGKNPPAKIVDFGKRNKRIIVTGVVHDVRPYIANAKVFVVPLRIGGGTRLKILEAMAMEKAVVSTRVGAEGIAYTEGKDIIIKDSPQDFADAVLMLLEDNQKRDALGKAGRDLVCRNYDWEIIGKKLNQVYRKVVGNDRQR